MLLGREVGDIAYVRWGPSSSQKGTQLPNFRPMSIVGKWSPITAEHLIVIAYLSMPCNFVSEINE